MPRPSTCGHRPEAESLLSIAAALGLACTVRPWGERYDGLAAPVVMVTTPVGAADDLADAVPQMPGALLDVVYNSGPTPLSTVVGGCSAGWSSAGSTFSSTKLSCRCIS